MNPINGIDIEFDFNKLIRITDLIYFNGPLLTHYISDNGENYLFHWVDIDDKFNRWLVFRVDILTLQNYIGKKSTLKNIIQNNNDGFVYSVDIDNEVHHNNIKLVFTRNIIM